MQKTLIFILIFINFTINSSALALKLHKFETPFDAPDNIPIFDINKKPRTLDEFEGDTILLIFWATWCSACVQEMPDLDILQKDFRKTSFKVIPVSQDYQGIEAIEKYYKAENIRYLDIFHDYNNQLFKMFEVAGIPTGFLISPEGKVLIKFSGFVNWHSAEVRNILLSHIAGNPPAPKNTYREQSLNQEISKNKSINKEMK